MAIEFPNRMTALFDQLPRRAPAPLQPAHYVEAPTPRAQPRPPITRELRNEVVRRALAPPPHVVAARRWAIELPRELPLIEQLLLRWGTGNLHCRPAEAQQLAERIVEFVGNIRADLVEVAREEAENCERTEFDRQEVRRLKRLGALIGPDAVPLCDRDHVAAVLSGQKTLNQRQMKRLRDLLEMVAKAMREWLADHRGLVECWGAPGGQGKREM